MADIEVQYKGTTIKSQTGSGTVTLHTEGKYCEDDIDIVYVAPSAPAPASLDDDVVFVDYDGTPVYSYTKAEFALLDALPDNPSHTGLTAQGWNWSLADAKAYMTDMDGLVIGQNYITDDGKTRLYITMEEPDLTFTLRFWADSSGKVDIDWGDGTTETPTGTGAKTPSHTYASGGDYVVTLYPTSGNLHCNNSIMSSTSGSAAQRRIRKAELGKNFMFGGDTFRACKLLKSVSIPTTATAQSGMFSSVFRDCYSLKTIVLPNGWAHGYNGVCYDARGVKVFPMPSGDTSLSGQPFYDCYSLMRFHIPKTVTTIPVTQTFMGNSYNLQKIKVPSSVTSIGQMFSNLTFLHELDLPEGLLSIGANMCTNDALLTHITIPSTVTEIGAAAFQNVTVRELRLKPLTPPTLANTNAFGFSAGAVIYVPQGKLTDYQTASNWSSYASYMVEESS